MRGKKLIIQGSHSTPENPSQDKSFRTSGVLEEVSMADRNGIQRIRRRERQEPITGAS